VAVVAQCFFIIGEIKILKNWKKLFWRLSVAKSWEKKENNRQIPVLGFHCVARNIEG
jgi:hypothetical protein